MNATDARQIAESKQRENKEVLRRNEAIRAKERESGERAVEDAAEKKASGVYRQYKKEITEAAQAGMTMCMVDEAREEVQYFSGSLQNRSDEKTFKDAVDRRAREIARGRLKDEGYTLETESQAWDTEWGAGSDALPLRGEISSWLEISW